MPNVKQEKGTTSKKIEGDLIEITMQKGGMVILKK